MTQDPIKQLGTVLSVWAHPDDESWCAAGLLAKAIENGQRVVCVTATRGEKGVQDESRWPAGKLGQIRQKELEKALEVLGITEHSWLDYIDGECGDVNETDAITRLQATIEQVRPDTILTFGPYGSTGHPDHIAVSRWTSQALKQAKLKKQPRLLYVADSKDWYETDGHKLDKAFNIFFNIDKPPLISEKIMDLCYNLPQEILAKKLAALRVQPSQTERIFASGYSHMFEKSAAREGFIRAERYAAALKNSQDLSNDLGAVGNTH